MTTELTETQPDAGAVEVPATAPGQSQGHRRRRRRRKNKTSQAAAPQAPAAQSAQAAPAQPAQPAVPAASAPRPQKSAPPKNQGRKKKFFPKGGSAQPGNGQGPAQPRQRKQAKQRTPRQFVGPMDHSYRAANGNVAEAPPSTIQLANGNTPQNHYQEPYAPAPVRADAPTRIVCFIEDLFFTAKIQETARKTGVKVEFIKGAAKEDLARLTDAPEDERPKLLVFDLNNANAKPLTIIPKLKAKFKKATSIVGFLNHLQGELKAKAVEAGCDTVMPRSAFSQTLPNLLRRYGLDDDEDQYSQPV